MPWRYNQQNKSCCSVKKIQFNYGLSFIWNCDSDAFPAFFQAYIFTRFKEVQRSIYLLLASVIYTFILLHRLSLHVLQLDQVKLNMLSQHLRKSRLQSLLRSLFVPAQAKGTKSTSFLMYVRQPRALNPLRSLRTCAC